MQRSPHRIAQDKKRELAHKHKMQSIKLKQVAYSKAVAVAIARHRRNSGLSMDGFNIMAANKLLNEKGS